MAILKCTLCVAILCGVSQAQDTGLRWQFHTGDTHKFRMTQTSKLDLQTGGGNQLNTQFERTFEFHWNVVSVDPNGNATIAIDVDALELRVSGPGGQTAEYDSTSEEEPRGFAASLTSLFRAILKSQWTAEVSPLGELIVLDVPEELQTVLHSRPAGKAVGQLGTVADLESFATLGLPPFPKASDFAEGDEWRQERKVQDAGVGSVVAETTYRWESSDTENGDQIARIVPRTVFRFPPREEGGPALSSSESLTSGEVLFNLTRGEVKSVTYNDAMEISTQGNSEPTAGTLHHTFSVEMTSAD